MRRAPRHAHRRPGPAPVGEVHVWRVALDRSDESVSPFQAVLARDERRRAERFHFARDRRRFSVTRGALRMLLARYLGGDPTDVDFEYGAHGKPRLAGDPSLRFNVSHSHELALLAFTHGAELGIDVERERRLEDLEEIAERFFSPRETTALRGLQPAQRPGAFFRCWTRKEAWIKATGDGLAQALHTFDVSLAPGETPRLEVVSGRPGEAERWWMADLEPAPGYAGALAIRGRPSRLVQWDWDELGEEADGTGPRRHHDLQGRSQPRGAVLDLAG